MVSRDKTERTVVECEISNSSPSHLICAQRACLTDGPNILRTHNVIIKTISFPHAIYTRLVGIIQ